MYYIFGNSTNIVSWVDEPNRRGTQEISTSCIVTIFLCVWTALHLNLPHRTNAKQAWYAKRQLWRKIGWLVMTLLVPEMTVYTAWFQRREAKRLKNLNINSPSNQEKWGMKHAFYAIMGGFVIDIEGEESFLPGQRRNMTLTAKGVQHIAERFPEIGYCRQK